MPGYQPYFEQDLGWGAYVEDGGDPSDGPSRYSRALRYAAREAVGNALDRGWRPNGVVGILHGMVLGDVDHWRAFHRRAGLGITRRDWVELMPSTTLTEITKEFDFHGPVMSVTAMCATGNAALMTAKLWIENGVASDVLVLASDLSLTPENSLGFTQLGVAVVDQLPTQACRPFQEGSRGFVGGEAAVAMVVSGRAGDAAYADVLGGAMTHDGFHAISIAPDGSQVRRCVATALANAGISGDEVAYLNAHGPGTVQCDAVEAAIFDEMFPAAHGLFSMKPLVGHCQGAASAVEILASLYGYQCGVIPAPPRVANGHPRLLDGPTAAVEGPVVKTALGMGGYNAAVVLGPPSTN
jgi:3-oxoacyl-[acyl-carrier-protein] synthase II